MMPILYKKKIADEIKNNDEVVNGEIIDEEETDEIDEEYESSNDDMSLCAKIGLGLLGVVTIGFGICKLLSSSNDEIRED